MWPMSDLEPFYFPDPAMFGHDDAYRLFTGFAAKLESAGLRDRFPRDAELRNVTIERLAEGDYTVEEIASAPRLIDDAIVEAEGIVRDRLA